MKRCPECRRDYYDDSLLYCLDDGTALLEGPASGNEQLTAFMDPPSTGSRPYVDIPTKHYGDGEETRGARRGNLLPVILVIGVLAASGIGYVLYTSLKRPLEAKPPSAAKPLSVQRLTGDGKTRQAQISPDGKLLAYKTADKGAESLHIRQIQTGSTVEVAKPADLVGLNDLVFSPDGSYIYFSAKDASKEPRSTYRVPALGGTPTRFIRNANLLRFAPDGKRVSFMRLEGDTETAIYVADSNGTNERKVASREGKKFFDSGSAWSPDGKFLVVAGGDDDLLPQPDENAFIVPVDGGAETEVSKRRWATVQDAIWHPSGDSVIVIASESNFTPGQVWQISYPDGDARQLTNNLNGYNGLSITQDGNAVVAVESYSRSAVYVSPDLDPKDARPVMSATGDTWGLAWTRDRRIVYVSDQSGDAEIWVMGADGGDPRQLTNDRVFKTTPVVSPDGRYIFYTSSAAGGTIVRIDMNGSNPVTIAADIGADNPQVSPDNKWLLYSAWIDGVQKILRKSVEGGEPQVLTSWSSTEPRYSLDGSTFACFSFEPESQTFTDLTVVPAEGGTPIKTLHVPPSIDVNRGPVWSPDERSIVVIVAKGEHRDLWAIPLDGSSPKQLTDFEMPVVTRREYSPDGKQLALVRAEYIGNAVMITNFR
ncbi:MAG TPA: hypothetical protein VL501_03890 [Pyrinomonadaceae bacterium]|nr:hypothetical protein [Pyrinomonadaceae bacterium]